MNPYGNHNLDFNMWYNNNGNNGISISSEHMEIAVREDRDEILELLDRELDGQSEPIPNSGIIGSSSGSGTVQEFLGGSQSYDLNYLSHMSSHLHHERIYMHDQQTWVGNSAPNLSFQEDTLFYPMDPISTTFAPPPPAASLQELVPLPPSLETALPPPGAASFSSPRPAVPGSCSETARTFAVVHPTVRVGNCSQPLSGETDGISTAAALPQMREIGKAKTARKNRAAELHRAAERRRRNRTNDMLNTLFDRIPGCRHKGSTPDRIQHVINHVNATDEKLKSVEQQLQDVQVPQAHVRIPWGYPEYQQLVALQLHMLQQLPPAQPQNHAVEQSGGRISGLEEAGNPGNHQSGQIDTGC